MTLTVMSQNAQYGADKDGRWEAMIKVIREVGPHLLLLQEVDWLTDPDKAEAARQALGMSLVVAPSKHLNTARAKCPSLKTKRVSAHVLRHTTAMNLLHHGVDRSVIALWLGHESMDTTQIYLHANLKLKEEALAKTNPFKGRNVRYRPPEHLLAFLQAL